MLNDFSLGDRVVKLGGSYTAIGTVVGLITTRAGLRRYVFEFDQPAGMLHIFNGDQLLATSTPPPAAP